MQIINLNGLEFRFNGLDAVCAMPKGKLTENVLNILKTVGTVETSDNGLWDIVTVGYWGLEKLQSKLQERRDKIS